MAKERRNLQIFEKADMRFIETVLNQIHDGFCLLDRGRKIVFWNKEAETISGYEESEVMGKQCPEDLALFTDLEGRPYAPKDSPAAGTLSDGNVRSAETYIQHKEGYRKPVFLRIAPVLDKSGQITAAAEVFTDTSPKIVLPIKVNELDRMSLLDPETGIPNKKFMEMHLSARLEEFRKYDLRFGLIYVDVDNQAKIIERFGRFNADKIIRMIARTIHKNIRYLDIVGRWDSDEFLIILINIDESHLDIVANKLRLLVAESYISMETGVINATVSLGACLVQRYDTMDGLIKRAEQLMMHSKWLGRNKVSLSYGQKEEA